MLLGIIVPTDKCNLRCQHCMRTQYGEEELNRKTLGKFLAGFEKYGLGKNFCITGGEATLHSDLGGILNVLDRAGFIGTIVTNGQSESGIEKILLFRNIITYVLVSLEGPTAEINDKIRGKGSFKKALSTIDLLKKNKFNIEISSTLNSLNTGLILEMLKLADAHNVDSLRLSPIEPCTNSEKNNLLATLDSLHKAHDYYLKICNNFKVKSEFGTRHSRIFTDSNWPRLLCRPVSDKNGELVLRPNGDVFFCCDLFDFGFDHNRYAPEDNENQKLCHYFGNVNQDDFGDILRRRKNLIEELISKRRIDCANGKLIGARQFICENCKYYFYK